MKVLSKKYYPVAAMIIILLSMALIGWFGIRPFHTYVVNKADEIQKFYAARENRQRQIDKLPDLETHYNTILQNEQKLDILLPENKIVDFVRTLEELARQTGTEIAIQSQDKGEIQDKKNVKKNTRKTSETEEKAPASEKKLSILESIPFDRYLQISITIRGEYKNIVNFLQKMETLPYGLDVIGVQMKVKEEDNTRVTVDPRNPFLLSPGNSLPVQTQEETKASIGKIEAVFDTVVYIDKNE